MTVLFLSTRRDGRSLGDMVRSEMGPAAGGIALIGVLLIMIILLAVLVLVVVKALMGSPWGTFTVFCTIPIGLLMGFYAHFIRVGRIAEMSAIGVVLLLASLIYGRPWPRRRRWRRCSTYVARHWRWSSSAMASSPRLSYLQLSVRTFPSCQTAATEFDLTLLLPPHRHSAATCIATGCRKRAAKPHQKKAGSILRQGEDGATGPPSFWIFSSRSTPRPGWPRRSHYHGQLRYA